MIRYSAILLSILLFGFMVPKHEFYVTITDLIVSNDTLQVAIKVFTHDFEEVIKEEGGEFVFLDQSTNQDIAFRKIKNYCAEHLQLANPSNVYDLKWVGHEYDDDVTWIYAYTILDPDSKMLFVKNTLFSSKFHNQSNMIHLSKDGTVQSELCTSDRPEVRFLIK